MDLKFDAIEVAKNEIKRILSEKNNLNFQEILNKFDINKYPHNIKSSLKDAIWQLWGLKIVSLDGDEISQDTVIHLNKEE